MRAVPFAAALAAVAVAGPALSHEIQQAQAAVPAAAAQVSPERIKSVLAKMPSLDRLSGGIRQVSPVVPAMGSHHASPETLPLGPIYCGYEGKIVCLEYMISQEDFKAGKTWMNLPTAKDLPPVDHVNIQFEPQGHEGFAVPHYDVHIYFIPQDVREAIR